MTANASSSSVTSQTETPPGSDPIAPPLPPLPTAWLAGRDLDLLAPLRLLPGGDPPAGPAPVLTGAAAAARRELAEALAVSNRAYGHEGADALARRLADPATRVVVTGQQPGLLGGPLYTFAKAVAAARWAAALEAAGQPAVAVFWVATEDHDWAEVSNATILGSGGPRTFDLGPDPAPLMPVGMRTLGDGVTGVLEEILAAVPSERYAEWLRTVARWYRPDARFGEAFCRLLAHMLGDRCPLLLDAMHPALKAAQRPWLRRLVERRREVEEAFEAREAEITGRGYPLQVAPQRGVSPLFLLHRGEHGERRRVEWRGDAGYALRGRDDAGGTVADLLRVIDENPGVVTPGVLARPAIQDAVLGTCLQVMGPGELSYLAQVAAIYPVLEVEAPWTSLRPQTLVLEANQAEKLAEAGITLADLLGDRQGLDRALAASEDGEAVAAVRAQVEQALESLTAWSLAADPNLERPLEKTREQILRALDTFAEKATGALARKNEVRSRRVEQLREACLPLGKLQERVVCAAHFQGKHGSRFAESYWEQMGLDPRTLHVISP